MKVLIVGGGGREHALAWKCAQSSQVNQVYVAPGNAGTALEPKVTNIAISATAISELLAFAQHEAVDLTIVGPEAPLVAGIVDQFTQANLRCFGPTQAAAQLESSKAYSKAFMRQHHIPTAQYAAFDQIAPALEHVQNCQFPIVIKADGLAAGKGVIITDTLEEAQQTLLDMLTEKRFGDAGSRVVIEEFLQGEEVSFIVVTDGIHALPLATSQDHKARDDGDTGPNTGGMGAYSPAPIITPAFQAQIMNDIIWPTIHGLSKQGIVYSGFLYAGLMIDSTGHAKVLEYNCRLGDPETQPILLRLQSDLCELCIATIEQNLDSLQLQWNPRPSLGVVLAAGGYPEQYEKGDEITGLTDTHLAEGKVFHAGTHMQDQKILTNGGRVLCVASLGDSLLAARGQVYENIQKIHWQDMYYRHDIGYRALEPAEEEVAKR